MEWHLDVPWTDSYLEFGKGYQQIKAERRVYQIDAE